MAFLNRWLAAVESSCCALSHSQVLEKLQLRRRDWARGAVHRR